MVRFRVRVRVRIRFRVGLQRDGKKTMSRVDWEM